LFGSHADVAQNGAGELGEETLDPTAWRGSRAVAAACSARIASSRSSGPPAKRFDTAKERSGMAGLATVSFLSRIDPYQPFAMRLRRNAAFPKS